MEERWHHSFTKRSNKRKEKKFMIASKWIDLLNYKAYQFENTFKSALDDSSNVDKHLLPKS